VKEKWMKYAIGLLAVGAIVAMVFAISGSFGGGDKDYYSKAQRPPGSGDATGYVVFDDGHRIHLKQAVTYMKDGARQEGQYIDPQHGIGYREFKCVETGETWQFGKNDQFTSPHVNK
jgi:hypothetical protein